MSCIFLMRAIQRQSAIQLSSVRHAASHHPLRFLEVQQRWREKDGVSQKYHLIYKAPMDQILNIATTYLTLSTTAVALSGTYYAAFIFEMAELDKPVLLGPDTIIANSGLECFSYLAAFLVFHVAVKILLSKYVVRLYKDDGDNYLAIFRGNFYNSITKHKFHLNEFKKLNPTLVVTWGDARFSLGKKHAILLDNYFKTPEDFNYLLVKKKAQIHE